ncbi:hypothetical protein [Kitasatospora cystarginea]
MSKHVSRAAKFIAGISAATASVFIAPTAANAVVAPRGVPYSCYETSSSGINIYSGHDLGIASGYCVGSHEFVMQWDGNLVQYNNNTPLWSSGTYGHFGATVWFQSDGNLVVYPAGGGPGGPALWASGTYNHPGAHLAIQADGNIVIDPWWAPSWPIVWQRTYSVARQWWLDSDGRVDWAQLPLETAFEGEQLGRWVRSQRAGWAELDQEQRDLLTALDIAEDQELAAARAGAAAKPKVSRADRFQQHLAALAAFVEREGHAKVPRAQDRGGAVTGHLVEQPKGPPGQAQRGAARTAGGPQSGLVGGCMAWRGSRCATRMVSVGLRDVRGSGRG